MRLLTYFQSCGYFMGRRHSQSSTHFPSCMSLSCYYTVDEIGWQADCDGRSTLYYLRRWSSILKCGILIVRLIHFHSVFLFGPIILSALGLFLMDCAKFDCTTPVYNKGDKKGEVCVSILVSPGKLCLFIAFATHIPPSIFADVLSFLSCFSSQHQPGEDEWGFEDAGERWLPVHTVESVVRPSLLFAADCHAR